MYLSTCSQHIFYRLHFRKKTSGSLRERSSREDALKHENSSYFKQQLMSVLILKLCSYLRRYKVYPGICCRTTFGFKSCVHTVHIQFCTSGSNKLQGPESKPANQPGKFNLVEVCCKLQYSNTPFLL